MNQDLGALATEDLVEQLHHNCIYWVCSLRTPSLLMLGVRGSARNLGWLDSRNWEPDSTTSVSEKKKWQERQEKLTVETEGYTVERTQTQRSAAVEQTQWEYEGSEDGSIIWKEDKKDELTTTEELERQDDWEDSTQRIVLSIREPTP
jgi:hypothetical protein